MSVAGDDVIFVKHKSKELIVIKRPLVHEVQAYTGHFVNLLGQIITKEDSFSIQPLYHNPDIQLLKTVIYTRLRDLVNIPLPIRSINTTTSHPLMK